MLFPSALNDVKVETLPISLGISPVKEQLDRVNVSSFVICPIFEGIGPLIGVSLNVKNPVCV